MGYAYKIMRLRLCELEIMSAYIWSYIYIIRFQAAARRRFYFQILKKNG
jgi:hypothetical protein